MPTSFLLVLLLLVIVAPVGVALLYRGVRGVPVLSEPRCRKCGYDLRTFGDPPKTCPECGGDLAKPKSVRFGGYQRKPKLAAVGALVLLSPFLLGAVLMFGFRAAGSGGGFGPSGNKSTPQLIAGVTANAGRPWDWDELERRLQNGQLSQQEAEQAIDGLITWLNQQTQRHGPLHYADDFIQQAQAQNLVDPAQFERLARAYYGPAPTVTARDKVRRGEPIEFSVAYGDHWDLAGVELVKAVREVRLDGEPVTLQSDRANDRTNLDRLSADVNWNIEGVATFDTEPGPHELTFVVDIAVLPQGSKPSMVENKPGQAVNWPNAAAQWTSEVKHTIEMAPADQPVVDLVTDPAMDPVAAGVLKVKDVGVTRAADGVIVKFQYDFDSPPLPVAFQVAAVIDGQEHEIGYVTRSARRSRHTQPHLRLDTLSPDVQTLDLVLRPDPIAAEGDPTINEIWGETVVLKDIPLHRYDLEAEVAQRGE